MTEGRKVLVLLGSPRRGGNTELLTERLLAQVSDATVRRLRVYDMDLGPCVDCRGCKSGALRCGLPDAGEALQAALEQADVLVFATPVYWYGPTGPMKNLWDRMRPFYKSQRLGGKKAVLVAPAADGPGDATLLVEAFARLCRALGMDFHGQVLGQAFEVGEILQDATALGQAEAVGAKL